MIEVLIRNEGWIKHPTGTSWTVLANQNLLVKDDDGPIAQYNTADWVGVVKDGK